MPTGVYPRKKKLSCLYGHVIAVVGRTANGMCRGCHNARAIAYNKRHVRSVRMNQRKWYKAHGNNYHWQRILMPTGLPITSEDYTRIYKAQNGKCANMFCAFRGKLHVDHSHKTQFFRGLLCGNCNRALGICRDDTYMLMGLAVYLKESARTESGEKAYAA